MPPLVEFTKDGMYCAEGGFYIDPWRKVENALITHGHSDHARWGMGHYLCASKSVEILKCRLGKDISVQGLPYGETQVINGVKVSFYPAGHVPGSAQIRIEYKGEVWVAAGDYKVENDGLSDAFEPIECHTFITESTFGMPAYRWQKQSIIAKDINNWWARNASEGVCSLLAGYSLGKIQRLLSLLDPSIGPIYAHPTVYKMNEVLKGVGFNIPQVQLVEGGAKKEEYRKGLVLVPPSASDGQWAKKFEPYEVAMASGWMALRGIRRRSNLEKGFVISDHADWPALLWAIAETKAEKVIVTHGYTHLLARFLQEQGLDAMAAETAFVGEGVAKDDFETPEESAPSNESKTNQSNELKQV